MVIFIEIMGLFIVIIVGLFRSIVIFFIKVVLFILMICVYYSNISHICSFYLLLLNQKNK